MNYIVLSLNDFFMLLLVGGVFSVVAVIIPVQISSKIRRTRRKRSRLTCRICGFRFLRRDFHAPACCPHCGATNKSPS